MDRKLLELGQIKVRVREAYLDEINQMIYLIHLLAIMSGCRMHQGSNGEMIAEGDKRKVSINIYGDEKGNFRLAEMEISKAYDGNFRRVFCVQAHDDEGFLHILKILYYQMQNWKS